MAETGLTINRKSRLIDLTLIVLICISIFAILEIYHPWFFLTDDNSVAYCCMYKHTMRSFTNGEFPFYNFHEFCGERFMGRGQTGSLNILVLVAAILSNAIFGHIDGIMDILALFCLLIGSVGSYLFLAKINCSRLASVIGAVAWNFNSYNILIGNSWIIIMMTTAFLPWIYLGTLMYTEKQTPLRLILSVIPRVMLFYCGHPQFFIYGAIFDFVFALTYVITSSAKQVKQNIIKLILEYIETYIPVFLLCLPLLLPTADLMTISERSDKLSFEDFVSVMMLTRVGFYGATAALFTVAGIILLILYGVKRKDSGLPKEQMNYIVAATPVLVITMLWITSVGFNRIIYLIPYLNKFRYQHKLTIVLISAVTVISSEAITIIENKLRSNKKYSMKILAVAGIALAAVQVLSLVGRFVLFDYRTAASVYTGSVPYTEKFDKELRSGRYVTLLNDPGYEDESSGMRYADTTASLKYDIPAYYGFDSVCGYYGVMFPKDLPVKVKMFACIDKYDVSGNCYGVYSNFVKDMRAQSVSWYVSDLKSRDKLAAYLAPYGITEYGCDDTKALFYDPEAEPYVTDCDGNPIAFEQHVNYLTINTDDSFVGGLITMNYTYDSNFRCLIDGAAADIIDDTSNWQMQVDCPSGKHLITIEYKERTFVPAIIVATAGTAVFIAAEIIIRSRRKSGQA